MNATILTSPGGGEERCTNGSGGSGGTLCNDLPKGKYPPSAVVRTAEGVSVSMPIAHRTQSSIQTDLGNAASLALRWVGSSNTRSRGASTGRRAGRGRGWDPAWSSRASAHRLQAGSESTSRISDGLSSPDRPGRLSGRPFCSYGRGRGSRRRVCRHSDGPQLNRKRSMISRVLRCCSRVLVARPASMKVYDWSLIHMLPTAGVVTEARISLGSAQA